MELKNSRVPRVISGVTAIIIGFLIGLGLVHVLALESGITKAVPPPPAVVVAATSVPPEVSDLMKFTGGDLLDRLEPLGSSQLKRVIRDCVGGDLLDVQRVAVMRAALEVLAAREPEEFLQWIDDGQVPVTIASSAIETAATIVARRGAINSIVGIDGASYSQLQRIAVAAYGAALADRDPRLAATQLIEAGRPYEAAWLVSTSWGSQAPAAAADFFASMRKDNYLVMQIGLSRTLSEWAIRDPQAAQKWLAGQPDKFTRSIGTTYLLRALASDSDSAETALQFLAELPNAAKRAIMARSLGHNIGVAFEASGDSGLLEQVMAFPDPQGRENLLATMARAISGPIAGEIINELSGQSLRSEAIEGAMIFASDLNEGFATIDTLQSPADRIAARSKLLSLRTSDPAEGAQVVFSAEFPKERELLLQSFASSLVPIDAAQQQKLPVDLSWIDQLLPSQRREIKSAVKNWAAKKGLKIPESLSQVL